MHRVLFFGHVKPAALTLTAATLSVCFLLVGAAAPEPTESAGTVGGDSPYFQHEQSEALEGGSTLSLFNHRFAGVAILLAGLSELWGALGVIPYRWMRLSLPAGLLGIGAYLAIFSDWEAWPIGPMTLAQTLFEAEADVRQHKLYAGLLLAVGALEWLQRTGGLRHRLWSLPLPALAVIGGGFLFLHVHGSSPTVALHHAIMGGLAILAGLCRGGADVIGPGNARSKPAESLSPWNLGWAALILLIGVELLIYSE